MQIFSSVIIFVVNNNYVILYYNIIKIIIIIIIKIINNNKLLCSIIIITINTRTRINTFVNTQHLNEHKSCQREYYHNTTIMCMSVCM